MKWHLQIYIFSECIFLIFKLTINNYFTIIIKIMALRSQLLSLELPDASGKIIPYYTYDGYLEEHDRHKIHHEANSLEKLKVTGGALLGFAAFIATRRLSLPVLSIRGVHVPVSGLFSGVVGAIIGYDIFTLYGNSRLNSIKRDILVSAHHLPLWSNLRNAVNPDRAFFELADQRHNEPLIFHSGLTPEAAAKLIPDKVIGKAPHKPQLGSAHPHGHH